MKHRVSHAVFGASSLALLALACAPDRAVAPGPAPGRPLFLVGETPTNSLIGGTPTLTFSAAEGAITIQLGVNRGIYNASRNGNADFRIEMNSRSRTMPGRGSSPPVNTPWPTSRLTLSTAFWPACGSRCRGTATMQTGSRWAPSSL